MKPSSVKLHVHSVVILGFLWPIAASRDDVNRQDTDPKYMCLNRGYHLPIDRYINVTCIMCYAYLFQYGGSFKVSCQGHCLESVEGLKLIPRPDDTRAMSALCRTLSEEDCTRVTSCCNDADACCQEQRKSSASPPDGNCPMTWDGYLCVNYTSSGTVRKLKCPSFIPSSDKGVAYKTCTGNGSWWREPVHDNEFTNYTSCIHVDIWKESVATIVSIVCNSVSIVFLLPALAIFTSFRQLRWHRHVRLHINLSTALLLASVTSLLMEKLVYYDGLYAPGGKPTFITNHQVGCTILNVLDLMFRMCPMFWMLCEGTYLTWLMVRSFQPLKNMTGFYLLGWGVPLLFIVVYIIVNVNINTNSPCWLKDEYGLLWIIYGPSIACISINMILFLMILRVLLKQLPVHPGEPSHFRKGVKATIVLIPLFGLQQFCIIYSPDASVPGYAVYNIARHIIIHSQGSLVALIFCFLNNEVHGYLRLAWKRWRQDSRHSSRRSTATLISSSIISHRASLPEINGSGIVLNVMHGYMNTALNEECRVGEQDTATGTTSTRNQALSP